MLNIKSVIPLLKYLNRDAMTPEALTEINQVLLGGVVPVEEIDRLSTLARTRGIEAMALSAAPYLVAAKQEKSGGSDTQVPIVRCPLCSGTFVASGALAEKLRA